MRNLGKVILHIPAREGSKRVPRKNIRLMAGSPMISYVIKAALDSEIADHVEFVHEVERKYRLPLPTYGHAADGNVHTQVMNRYLENGEFGDEIPNWREAYEKVRKDIYQDAIQRGGVISGEHGVGLLKLDYIAENLGEANIDMMRAIKKAMDPLGIFNPGKVIRLS